ncbi:ABC transporter substrate-binding protein [Kroppenstedtia eburnea]|uniref:Amino acid ABC transporter substrate-binding protein, PAAT family n=1 Tax=Kroppenstedtia eburnea TaxID=714067 RepID=A0A1N7N9T4_9BACL|nr:ABC transporter substrate-binding protein [Kroppenstedtia eburnea]EGK11627.1 arginine ABC superfamily ATP binding cassette transporter, binding protein [Desmospora sp. 8437]QKI83124.1 transporter substrate-binding domain-containing protein [Kroppenstedtia eburnea]SIS95082.1 amino acid ABC transporter substrate-binding protein, PAAT family [Kroppenstedtia eburnea]
MVVMLTLTGLLAACGGEADSGKGMKLKEEGKLTFAMSGLYKPYNFKQSGQLTGFDVEIGKAIAKEMGLKPNPVTTPWETIVAGLQAGKYDAVIGSMGITEKRKKAVLFTDPYYRSGAQVFIREGNDEIGTPEDMKGKKIGVVKASTYKDEALKYSKEIKEYTSDVVALQDLPTGRIDAVITDEGVGDHAIKHDGLKIRKVGKPLTMDEMGIAIHKNNPGLEKEINQALKNIIENGTYEKISQEWFNRNILSDQP